MKNSLMALAALATAGVASAQSSVTLFGIVDAAITHGSGSVSNKTQMTNSGNSASRLGFRGTEDLGGGISASFWLEASVNNDDGTGRASNTNNQASGAPPAQAGGQGLTFNRRSTVSLASDWGELRLGRDFTPYFWNLTIFDPFAALGVGTTQVRVTTGGMIGVAAVDASNSIGYFLPGDLGGFYGQIQYFVGENNRSAANPHDGNGLSMRGGYTKGPINIALATGTIKYAAGDIRASNIGAQWDFGVARLMGLYSRDRVASPVALNGHGGLIGVQVPVGVGEIRASYSLYRTDAAGNPKTTKWALGYVHNLSKRTALYGTYARVGNNGGAAQALGAAITAPNGSSTGFDIGLRHTF